MKRIYISPQIEVREIAMCEILAGSTIPEDDDNKNPSIQSKYYEHKYKYNPWDEE